MHIVLLRYVLNDRNIKKTTFGDAFSETIENVFRQGYNYMPTVRYQLYFITINFDGVHNKCMTKIVLGLIINK